MEPATMAAIGSSVLSAGGSVLDYKANKQAAKQAEEQLESLKGDIIKYGGRATDPLLPAYQAGQDVRKEGFNANLALSGNLLEPRMDAIQDSGYMAQQALLAGLIGSRNAVLGDPINYGNLQPQSVPIDMSALTGITNPTGLTFADIKMPEFGASSGQSAQQNWDAGTTAQYLANYPDIAEYYEANKKELIKDSGNPIFNSLEGYAKWHYDNHGKRDKRVFDRPLAMVAAQGAQTTNIGSGAQTTIPAQGAQTNIYDASIPLNSSFVSGANNFTAASGNPGDVSYGIGSGSLGTQEGNDAFADDFTGDQVRGAMMGVVS